MLRNCLAVVALAVIGAQAQNAQWANPNGDTRPWPMGSGQQPSGGAVAVVNLPGGTQFGGVQQPGQPQQGQLPPGQLQPGQVQPGQQQWPAGSTNSQDPNFNQVPPPAGANPGQWTAGSNMQQPSGGPFASGSGWNSDPNRPPPVGQPIQIQGGAAVNAGAAVNPGGSSVADRAAFSGSNSNGQAQQFPQQSFQLGQQPQPGAFNGQSGSFQQQPFGGQPAPGQSGFNQQQPGFGNPVQPGQPGQPGQQTGGGAWNPQWSGQSTTPSRIVTETTTKSPVELEAEKILDLLLAEHLSGTYLRNEIREYNSKIPSPSQHRPYWIGDRYYYRDPASDIISKIMCKFPLPFKYSSLHYDDNTPVNYMVFQCVKFQEACCYMDCCNLAETQRLNPANASQQMLNYRLPNAGCTIRSSSVLLLLIGTLAIAIGLSTFH